MEAMVKLLDADVPIALDDMARDVFELAWMLHDARPKWASSLISLVWA